MQITQDEVKKMSKQLKHIAFKIKESFPLTPLEVKFFLENCDDYFMKAVKGRKELEGYLETKTGRKVSEIFSKLMKYDREE